MNPFKRINRFLRKDKAKRRQSVRARKIALFHFFRPKKALLSLLPYGFYWYAHKEHMSNQIYVGLHEENEILYLQKNAKSNWVSLDIGANAGFYSLLLHVLCPEGKIYAYEPSKREWDRLQQHLQKNNTSNIIAQKIAVGNKNGEIELHIHEGTNMGMNTTKPDPRFVYTGKETVQLVTIDSEIEKLGIQKIDFVKLDVEGLEKEVLDGSTQSFARFKPTILCEIWEIMNVRFDEGSKQSPIVVKLAAMGYEAYQPNDFGALEKITSEKIIRHNNVVFIHTDRKSEFIAG